MLKRILLVFSLVLFFSCSREVDVKTERIKAQQELKELKEKSAKEKKTVDGRFVYNIGGVIFKKEYEEIFDHYYFYIKLDNDKLIEWEVTSVKYHYKDVGDTVFFEYLKKERFSDKAID